jgi:formate dehydrogenase subunit gamma
MKTVEKTTRGERVNHLLVAVSFFVLLVTGLGFLFKSINWFNIVFGGYHLAAHIHKWAGVVFMISILYSTRSFLVESLRFSSDDVRWLVVGGGYISGAEVPPQERLNAGMKLMYLTVILFGLLISASGLIMWLVADSRAWMQMGHLLHNIAAVVFCFAIPTHIYLAITATPGAFTIMTRGTVPLDWAKKKHGKWVEKMGLG